MPEVTQEAGTLWRSKPPFLTTQSCPPTLIDPAFPDGLLHGKKSQIPLLQFRWLEGGEWGTSPLGFRSYHYPEAQGNWTSSSGKGLPFPRESADR